MSAKFPHFNPYMMGLMGGAQGFLAGLGSYFDEQRRHGNKVDEIHAKYDAMTEANKARADNQRLLKAMQIEGSQRAYTVKTLDDKGTPVEIQYRNIFNPDTGGFEPHEMGRVPLAATQKQTAPVTRTIRKGGQDVTVQWNPESHSWDELGSGPHFKDDSDKRPSPAEMYKQGQLNYRTRLENERKSREAASKAASQAVKDLQYLDPTEKKAALQREGIDPNAADAMKQYREKVRQSYLNEMSASPASGADSSAAQPGASNGAQPATTAKGQPIWWKDGQPYVQDASGKKVPYDPSKDVPLAMDQAHAAMQNGDADPSSPVSDDDATNAPGLLASADENDDEDASTSDDDDTGEDDEQSAPRGLMG